MYYKIVRKVLFYRGKQEKEEIKFPFNKKGNKQSGILIIIKFLVTNIAFNQKHFNIRAQI